MDVSVISPSDPLWAESLASTAHDSYQLPSYADHCARFDGGPGAAAKAVCVRSGSRSLLVPIIARPIAEATDGAWDAVSPYGYPGVLVKVPDEGHDRFVRSALEAAGPALRELGCVSMFLRLHPILSPTVPEPASALLVEHGNSVVVDLSKSHEEFWSATRSSHRNHINRAANAGFRAYMDDDLKHLERFVEIYRETMRRVGAAPGYFYGFDYAESLRDALGDRFKLAVVEKDGEIACAAMFFETGPIVQYHLSGTADAFLPARPLKLMLHHVRGWSKDRGARWFSLGGGLGGAEDSLFHFKAGFSKDRAMFRTLRMVTDVERYESLTRSAVPGTDPVDLSGFFPAYRAV